MYEIELSPITARNQMYFPYAVEHRPSKPWVTFYCVKYDDETPFPQLAQQTELLINA
jgi:hypothetical protein